MRIVLAATLALLFLGSDASAQKAVEKGVWTLGGSVRVVGLHDDANDKDEFTVEVMPQVGYFVFDRFAVSGNVRMVYSRRESTGRTIAWGLGPGLTYYLKRLGAHFHPYAAVRVLFSRSTFKPDEDAPSASRIVGTERSWQAGVGGALFIARNVAITAELFYSRASFKDEISLPSGPIVQKNSSSLYGLQFGVRVFIY